MEGLLLARCCAKGYLTKDASVSKEEETPLKQT